jgi:hypothetical protein
MNTNASLLGKRMALICKFIHKDVCGAVNLCGNLLGQKA